MPLYATGSGREGIVHVIGPELGLTQPGHDDRLRRQPHVHARRVRRARVRDRHVRGRARARDADAHAGAPRRPMRVRFVGALPPGRDARRTSILGAIGRLGVAGGVGHVDRVRAARRSARLSMEGRMTVCNMSIEAGARAGMIAPDDTTFAYLEGRPGVAEGRGVGARRSSAGARCLRRRRALRPRGRDRRRRRSRRRSRGARTPAWSRRSTGRARPGRLRRRRTSARRSSARSSTWASSRARRSRTSASTASSSAPARTRGSRTCAPRPRSSPGRRVARRVRAMVVPGSAQVKRQAEAEGLDRIFERGRLRVARAPAARCASA